MSEGPPRIRRRRRHVDIVRVMTDGSGVSPAHASSGRSSDVRVSVRSALARRCSLLALTVLMLEIARHAERVIAWVLVAGGDRRRSCIPVVEFGSRSVLPRGLVVLLARDRRSRRDRLRGLPARQRRLAGDASACSRPRRNAPAELEKNSDLLRQVHFKERVHEARRRHPASASRAARRRRRSSRRRPRVSRSSPGLILTIFFLLYGPRIFDGGLGSDRRSDAAAARRARADRDGTRRGLDYARIKLLEAFVEGLHRLRDRAGGGRARARPRSACGSGCGRSCRSPGVFIGALPIVRVRGRGLVERRGRRRRSCSS